MSSQDGPVKDGTHSGVILNDWHARKKAGEEIDPKEEKAMATQVILLELLGR